MPAATPAAATNPLRPTGASVRLISLIGLHSISLRPPPTKSRSTFPTNSATPITVCSAASSPLPAPKRPITSTRSPSPSPNRRKKCRRRHRAIRQQPLVRQNQPPRPPSRRSHPPGHCRRGLAVPRRQVRPRSTLVREHHHPQRLADHHLHPHRLRPRPHRRPLGQRRLSRPNGRRHPHHHQHPAEHPRHVAHHRQTSLRGIHPSHRRSADLLHHRHRRPPSSNPPSAPPTPASTRTSATRPSTSWKPPPRTAGLAEAST